MHHQLNSSTEGSLPFYISHRLEIWMFHRRKMNNRINKHHKRKLRIVYIDYSKFQRMLNKDNSLTIHQKNRITLETGMYNVKAWIAPETMEDVFSYSIQMYSVVCLITLGKVKRFNVNISLYICFIFIFFCRKYVLPFLTSIYRNFVMDWLLSQFLQKPLLLKISANFKWIDDTAITHVFHVFITWIWGESCFLWTLVGFYSVVQFLPYIVNILFSSGYFYPTWRCRDDSSCQYCHQIFIVQSCGLS